MSVAIMHFLSILIVVIIGSNKSLGWGSTSLPGSVYVKRVYMFICFPPTVLKQQ